MLPQTLSPQGPKKPQDPNTQKDPQKPLRHGPSSLSCLSLQRLLGVAAFPGGGSGSLGLGGSPSNASGCATAAEGWRNEFLVVSEAAKRSGTEGLRGFRAEGPPRDPELGERRLDSKQLDSLDSEEFTAPLFFAAPQRSAIHGPAEPLQRVARCTTLA